MDEDGELQRANKATIQALVQEVKADNGKLEKIMAELRKWDSVMFKADANIASAEGE